MGFDIAVWQHVWRDIQRAATDWVRVVIEGVVLFGVTFIALTAFGSADSVADHLVEGAIALPLSLVLLMVIHFLWSWARAPRHIYAEQQDTIASLQSAMSAAGDQRTAVLLFLEDDHYRNEGSLHLWRIGVKRIGRFPAISVSLRMHSCVPVGRENKKEREGACGRVKDMRFGLSDYPGHVIEQLNDIDSFDCVEVLSATGPLTLCHFNYNPKTGRDPVGFLPRGKYNLTLRAEAANADTVYFKVVVSFASNGRLKMVQA